MTIEEKQRILTNDFDTLWKNLWGDDINTQYRGEEKISREKFESLKYGIDVNDNDYSLESLVNESKSQWLETEWGFPKGRRVRTETDLECAIREFGEETNVPREAYVVLNNILLEETFTGLNGVQYRHVYFVALLSKPELVNLGQKMTYMQKREISGIGWKTLAECRAYVRPHHVERAKMLDQLTEIVRTYESSH
jgi:8-oxo-dGTP pyrophosphatase MutT (NUDIX family)